MVDMDGWWERIQGLHAINIVDDFDDFDDRREIL